MESIISEAVFAKNVILKCHGDTPYHPLAGRSPVVLSKIEAPGITRDDDTTAAPGAMSRHVVRLREIAVQSIAEATAKHRLHRALVHPSRRPGESLALTTGGLVDFHRPAGKDVSGRRGPATVTSLQLDRANPCSMARENLRLSSTRRATTSTWCMCTELPLFSYGFSGGHP